MSEPFDPDEFLRQTAHPAAGFDPDKFLAETAPRAPAPERTVPQMALDAIQSGQARSFGRGALQGATLNFGDEIQGWMGRTMQRGINRTPSFLLDALAKRGL